MTILTCLGDSITDCDHCFTADFLGNGYVQMLSKRFEKEGISQSVHGNVVWYQMRLRFDQKEE